MLPAVVLLLLAAQSWVVLDAKTGKALAAHDEIGARLPGSAVKPLTAAALIDGGLGAMTVSCTRRLRIGSRRFDCSHPALGRVGLADAIAFSCNQFFAEGAKRLRPGAWEATLRRLGLAPRPAAGARERQLAAIEGEGLECTAAQLAEAYRRLAAARYSPVTEGMRRAVEDGTAQGVRLPGVEIAGKTGTARHHGWFAGWSAVIIPRVIVVLLVEPGTGPADAAPAARKLFERYAR